MTTNVKNLVAWVLAPLGAVVALVAVFAETFGLGSGNGQFGRWQITGVLAGCLLLAAGLVLSGNARVVWKRVRRVVRGWEMWKVSAVMFLAVFSLAAVWFFREPHFLEGWDCSDPTADGWVTCTLYDIRDCGYVGRLEYNVKDGPPPPEDVDLTGVACNL